MSGIRGRDWMTRRGPGLFRGIVRRRDFGGDSSFLTSTNRMHDRWAIRCRLPEIGDIDEVFLILAIFDD